MLFLKTHTKRSSINHNLDLSKYSDR